jgi:chromosome segregation ATPase
MPTPTDSTNPFTALRQEMKAGFETVERSLETVGQDMRAGFAEASRQMSELIGHVREIHEALRGAGESLADHHRRIATLEVQVEELRRRRRFAWPWRAS